MAGRLPFRKLLPLVMTSVQLVLLALSLAQQWHLPTSPAELHRKYPPTAPYTEGDEDGTVSFSPQPQDIETTTVFKVAMATNLPAIFCGDFIAVALIPLGVKGGGEALLIAIGALLGFQVWRLIGRWVDEQRAISHGIQSVRSKRRGILRSLLRGLAFLVLCLLTLSLPSLHHYHSAGTIFVVCTGIAWSGVYLLLSIWGEKRETRLARSKAVVQAAEGS